MLSRLRPHLPTRALMSVYSALFKSYVRYCLPVWGFTTETNKTRIHTLHNFAIRAMHGLGSLDSVAHLYSPMKILTFDQELKLSVYKTMYKHFYKLGHQSVGLNFETVTTVHAHQTRAAMNNLLFEPRFTLHFAQNSCLVVGCALAEQSKLRNSIQTIPSTIHCYRSNAVLWF